MRGFMTLMILIMLPFPIPPAVSSLTSTKAKLHDPAHLTCEKSCSGSVKWIVYQSDRTVAHCDRKSCDSEKGFKTVHDQYLKGNITLIVSSADYSDRRLYICQCDGREICRVNLIIEPIEHFINTERGGSFSMDVSITESVKVMFSRTGDDQNSVIIYEIDERKVKRHQEYEDRALFKDLLTLKDLNDSDSGIYTVWDTINKEAISTYNLTVTGPSADTNRSLPTGEPRSLQSPVSYEEFIAAVGLGGLVVGMLLGFFVIPIILKCCCGLWRRCCCLGGEQSSGDVMPGSSEGEKLQPDKVALESVSLYPPLGSSHAGL